MTHETAHPHTPPPAVAAAWNARGYTSLQLEARLEAQARRARMQGGVAEPPPPRRPPQPPPEPAPTPRRAAHARLVVPAPYAYAHALLDWLAAEDPGPLLGGDRSAAILSAFCQAWNGGGLVIPADLIGRSRILAVERARVAAVWVHRKLQPKHSTVKMGYFFRRDHSTIMSTLRRAKKLLAEDDAFAASVAEAAAEVSRQFEPTAEPCAGGPAADAFTNANHDQTGIRQ